MLCEGSLLFLIHFFPCLYLLTFQTLLEPLVSEENGTNTGAGSLLSACSFEDGYVFLFRMLCVILGCCKPVEFSDVRNHPV